jgi:hypothetical protein
VAEEAANDGGGEGVDVVFMGGKGTKQKKQHYKRTMGGKT